VGTCRQQTLKNATLYLGNTAEAGSDAIAASAGSSLYKPVPNGTTKFDITFTLLRPGLLHVTIYDLDNHDKNETLMLASISATSFFAAEPPILKSPNGA